LCAFLTNATVTVHRKIALNSCSKATKDFLLNQTYSLTIKNKLLASVLLQPLKIRLHLFDHAGQILRIESAVPEKMVASIHAGRFVIAILLDAIDAAGEFFSEQHILFDVSEHLALVDLVITKEQRAMN
jgi:hypothetical protein